MPLAEAALPSPVERPDLGGGVDIDHLAALMMRMAATDAPTQGGAPASVPATARPASPMGGGAAGPGHPTPEIPGVVPFAGPGFVPDEAYRASTAALMAGLDPSVVSLDLATFRAAPPESAPLPSAPSRAADPASTGFEARAPSSAEYYFLPDAAKRAPDVPAAHPAPGRPVKPSGRIRDDFPILAQPVNGHRLVWLDSAATTQKPEVVIEAEAEFYRTDNSNVHRGAHTLARRATEAYERARAKVQRFLGASSPTEIVFVRGTTEGMNLIAQSLGRQTVAEGDEVIVSHLEHHSNIVPWQMLCREKKAILRVAPVDEQGNLRLDALERMIGPRTRIVSITQVSNVLGTLVPITPIAALAHRHGAVLVVDGAQAAAHIPVDVMCMDADFYVFSGHKLYAPTGIGAVYGKAALWEGMPPWQGGGSMIESVSFEETVYAQPPAKFEAGTGHFAGAVGLGAAIDYLQGHGMQAIAAHEQALVRHAVDALRRVPGLILLGDPAVRIGALSFVLEGREPAAVAAALDQRGIAVRAGHHCAQPILARYGYTTTVRASLGVYSAEDDIEALVDALKALRNT